MKKISIILFFVLAISGFGFAQSRLPEFNTVKKIILLESTRTDVRKILASYKSDDKDGELFTAKNSHIEISYTTGDCSDEDSEEAWNVLEGKVSLIEISPNKPVKIEDLGFTAANYRKEQKYSNADDLYVYHNKNFGIAFEVDENEIEKIILFPSNSYKSLLCSNETVKKFYSSESWFENAKLEDRTAGGGCTFASVTDLTLSENEIIIGCKNPAKNQSCPVGYERISVTTLAIDPENDVLTYHYTVSGGKIVGEGKEVVWDLRGVKPGTYTITAGVDDGCGVCGETKTKTVIVKECPACSVKK